MKLLTVIDPTGKEHVIPEADREHFEQKEGWEVKGAKRKKRTTKKNK